MNPENLLANIPPQAIELEETILGILINWGDEIDNVINIINTSCFYKTNHQIIFNAILNLYENKKGIDILTITEELRKTNDLETIGGSYALSKIASKVISPNKLNFYSAIIAEKHIRRILIKISNELAVDAYDGNIDIDIVLSNISGELLKVNEFFAGSFGFKHVKEIVEESLANFKKRIEHAKTEKLIGIPTGLTILDNITLGWQPSTFIIVAARPSIGKTAFALNFAIEAAKKNNDVCFYSLEMSETILTDRLIVSLAHIDNSIYKSGKNVDTDTLNKVISATKELAKLPIYIDDKGDACLNYIVSNARIMHKKGKCKLIIIDYIQLATDNNNGSKSENREQKVASMSRKVKLLSKEINVPIIVLAQLNRGVENKVNKIPSLSSLRESGSLEQDADMVIFIHRPAFWGDKFMLEDDTEVSTKNRGHLVIAKHREGAVGTVPFYHSTDMTQIKNASSVFGNSNPDRNISPISNDMPF
jgi:replicative DNA helicase